MIITCHELFCFRDVARIFEGGSNSNTELPEVGVWGHSPQPLRDFNELKFSKCDPVCEKGSYSLFNCMYLATCNLTCECGITLKFTMAWCNMKVIG